MKYKNCHKLIFCIAFIMLIVCGCNGASVDYTTNSQKINILCTGFSQYDWTKNIVGELDTINVDLLQKMGVDIHNFQPSADDIIRISGCDMIICTGGESDKPIINILDSLGDKKPIVINMMSELEPHLICIDEHSSNQHHTHNNTMEYDEHIWLSIKNADVLCRIISDNIISIDHSNAETYKANTEQYLAQLSNLDKKYQNTIDNSLRREIVFADRYPFAYLAKDYELTCFCAFPGCSAETEASFETVVSLAEKIGELNLTSVMTIDKGYTSIDEAVISNCKTSGIKTLSLNSLQSVSNDEINSGLSYLSTMEDNLSIIKESLN